MFHKTLNWGFYTDPDPGMNGRRIYWPRDARWRMQFHQRP